MNTRCVFSYFLQKFVTPLRNFVTVGISAISMKKNYIANYNLRNKVWCLHLLYASLSYITHTHAHMIDRKKEKDLMCLLCVGAVEAGYIFT